MTIGTPDPAASASAATPEKPGPLVLARGTLISGLLGAGLACIVVGPVIDRQRVFFAGWLVCLTAVAVVPMFRKITNRPRPRRVRPEPVIALARIESRRALSSEGGDIPIEFVLTVAPDDASAFRAKFDQHINLVDVPDYKPRGVVVVSYRPDRPWDVTIVTEPDEAWARRAATESVDSAPESTLIRPTAEDLGCATCLLSVAGFLAGAAVVIIAYRGPLFDDDKKADAPKPTVGTSATVSGT